MKKILIAGEGSYIGESFKNYVLKNSSAEFSVESLDMQNPGWKDKSFAEYDIIFQVAGIVHQKETAENEPLYYAVNRDMTAECAEKAKADGVSQYIFLSTMSVYGLETGVITKQTAPAPKTHYGKSKLMAEEKLSALADDGFKVCIIRPPMVYGEGCKGNYKTLEKLSEKSPVFPKIKNRRSLIEIENLCSFVLFAAQNNLDGVFMPQNREYVCTMDLISEICRRLGKKMYFSRLCGLGVKILMPFSSMLSKAFGDLIYEDTEDFGFSYCIK